MEKLRLGREDRLRLIQVAREVGFSDAEILREILRGNTAGITDARS